MPFGPYASFIVTSYLAVAVMVSILIAWVAINYRSQNRCLRELDENGIVRRSERSATDAT
jgi:heme exporter protein D